MTAQVIDFYQTAAQRRACMTRLEKNMEAQAIEIANIAFPSVFGEINVLGFGGGIDDVFLPPNGKEPA
jgi:hypothetical protein